jgi:hypothetical protein
MGTRNWVVFWSAARSQVGGWLVWRDAIAVVYLYAELKKKNPSGKTRALVNLCVCLGLYYDLDIVVYFYYVE